MHRPTSHTWNPTLQCSELRFGNAVDFCDCRGALAWPMGQYAGYAVVGAYDIYSRVISVYEEQSFNTIGLLGENIPHESLIHFLKKAWNNYHVRKWYWTGDEETHDRFRAQLRRKQWALDFSPVFIRKDFAENLEAVDALVAEYVAAQRLRIHFGEGVHTMLRDLQAQNKRYSEQTVPLHIQAVTALRALISGYETLPYKRPEQTA